LQSQSQYWFCIAQSEVIFMWIFTMSENILNKACQCMWYLYLHCIDFCMMCCFKEFNVKIIFSCM
jgi:hypothetical protein